MFFLAMGIAYSISQSDWLDRNTADAETQLKPILACASGRLHCKSSPTLHQVPIHTTPSPHPHYTKSPPISPTHATPTPSHCLTTLLSHRTSKSLPSTTLVLADVVTSCVDSMLIGCLC